MKIALVICAFVIIVQMVNLIVLRRKLMGETERADTADTAYSGLDERFTRLLDLYSEADAERDRLADIVCGDVPKSLGDLAKEIHKQAVAHGWWEDERSFPEIVALCHSELSEALEEYRNSRPARYVVADIVGETPMILTDPMSFEGRKPEGIAVEMADCIIRILDWCGNECIDIDGVIEQKMAYNETRPYKHGNKVC